VEWTYTYEPYGTKRSAVKNITTAPSNPMQYTGQRFDSATSLSHLRARMYDSATGRFLAQDPLAAPIAAPYMSSYAYAGDNPMALVDPSGMASEGSNVGFWDVVGEMSSHPVASWRAGMPEFCESTLVRASSWFDLGNWGHHRAVGKVVVAGVRGFGAYLRLMGKSVGLSPTSTVFVVVKASSRASLAATVWGTEWGVMCRIWA
jgi:RHS repeat-associated protein